MNKYHSIATDIRNEIISGFWKPGERLPTQMELRAYYDTTAATMQKAMEELQQEHFIAACGKSGTFVTKQPPHLFNYAVVVPAAQEDVSNWDTLWTNFVNQQKELEAHFNCRFVFYYLEDESVECREFRRLQLDAEYGRLAGIIVPQQLSAYLLHPLSSSMTPCVVMTRDRLENVNTVWVDYGSFFHQAFDTLLAKGRKRIAVLSEVRMPRDYIEDLCRYAEGKGVPIPPEFRLGFRMEPLAMEWLDSLIALLLRGDDAIRPDGIILANENFRDHVFNVLQQKKLSPGKDVDIVFHTNSPSAATPYPVTQLGFEVGEIVNACLKTLNQYRSTGIIGHSELVRCDCQKSSFTDGEHCKDREYSVKKAFYVC